MSSFANAAQILPVSDIVVGFENAFDTKKLTTMIREILNDMSIAPVTYNGSSAEINEIHGDIECPAESWTEYLKEIIESDEFKSSVDAALPECDIDVD